MSKNKDSENEIIQGHDYDGIQELNNPLPAWWLGIFWVTGIFGVVYYGYYEFGGGPTLDQELEAAMKNIVTIQETAKEANPQIQKSDEELQSLIADTEALKRGATVFQTSCAACHGANGEGTIGPNLTDEYWIHKKGSISDIVTVIAEGIPDKGMPPWASSISSDDIAKTAAFIVSLKGSNPSGAKAPQGEKVTN